MKINLLFECPECSCFTSADVSPSNIYEKIETECDACAAPLVVEMTVRVIS